MSSFDESEKCTYEQEMHNFGFLHTRYRGFKVGRGKYETVSA